LLSFYDINALTSQLAGPDPTVVRELGRVVSWNGGSPGAKEAGAGGGGGGGRRRRRRRGGGGGGGGGGSRDSVIV